MERDLGFIAKKVEEALNKTRIDIIEITELTEQESIDLKHRYFYDKGYEIRRIKNIGKTDVGSYIIHVSRSKD